MKFAVSTRSALTFPCDALAVPVSEQPALAAVAKELNRALDNTLQRLRTHGDVTGKGGSSVVLHDTGKLGAKRVLVIGIGAKYTLGAASFQSVLSQLAIAVKKTGAKHLALSLDDISVDGHDVHWQALQVTRIFTNSTYVFDRYKSKREAANTLERVTLLTGNTAHAKQWERALHIGQAMCSGTTVARDLGNMPGNECTPTYMAKQAQTFARKHASVTAKVINEAQMKRLGMGGILAVSAGSAQPATMTVLEYRGGKTGQRPVVLIGKGITFDSGGISLKPGGGMEEMKFDMCGAASVLGTLTAICELKLPINVIGIMVCAENMPSGTATRPGDIITTMSGQTVEVVNTDAEGRLVLCDALTYAERYKPHSVIDIATLTGACVIALGSHATGLFSNDDKLAHQLLVAGESTFDRAWRMPVWEDYQKQLKSPYADMSNVGGRNAGSVTAACFLARYTRKYHWAHLDIAGTAWNSGDIKGATGRPVPLLVQYLSTVAAS